MRNDGVRAAVPGFGRRSMACCCGGGSWSDDLLRTSKGGGTSGGLRGRIRFWMASFFFEGGGTLSRLFICCFACPFFFFLLGQKSLSRWAFRFFFLDCPTLVYEDSTSTPPPTIVLLACSPLFKPLAATPHGAVNEIVIEQYQPLFEESWTKGTKKKSDCLLYSLTPPPSPGSPLGQRIYISAMARTIVQ